MKTESQLVNPTRVGNLEIQIPSGTGSTTPAWTASTCAVRLPDPLRARLTHVPASPLSFPGTGNETGHVLASTLFKGPGVGRLTLAEAVGDNVVLTRRQWAGAQGGPEPEKQKTSWQFHR